MRADGIVLQTPRLDGLAGLAAGMNQCWFAAVSAAAPRGGIPLARPGAGPAHRRRRPFRGEPLEAGGPPGARAPDGGLLVQGLRSYKAKFEPAWEERFLVYPDGPPGLTRTRSPSAGHQRAEQTLASRRFLTPLHPPVPAGSVRSHFVRVRSSSRDHRRRGMIESAMLPAPAVVPEAAVVTPATKPFTLALPLIRSNQGNGTRRSRIRSRPTPRP